MIKILSTVQQPFQDYKSLCAFMEQFFDDIFLYQVLPSNYYSLEIIAGKVIKQLLSYVLI